MGRGLRQITLSAALAFGLAGCGFADSRAPVFEFMRKAEPATPIEPAPDLKRLAREKLDTLFLESAHPQRVRVSSVHRRPSGPGWAGCLRADTLSVTGQPTGTLTYLLTVENGVITDRRLVDEDESNCASETYEPITPAVMVNR